MGRKKGRDCLFIVCFEQEKAKNTSERRGGEKGVMSGIFDGLPCCMANKAGTDRPSLYCLLLACARQQKGEKGGEAWTDHPYKPTSYSDPAARPIR